MLSLATVTAAAPKASTFRSGRGSSRQGRPLKRTQPLVAAAARRPDEEKQGGLAGGAADGARKALAAALLSSALLIAGPSTADGLDTDTYKAGVGAKIEYSDITQEKATDVVDKLKQVLPDAAGKMGKDVEGEGSTYPASIVQELKTVASEVDALDEQAKGGGDESVVKSTASGIEQQINALKGILGFD
ncbi:hypothetical protein ABPG77_007779 [Micractinium sp. CCAP 211/92]